MKKIIYLLTLLFAVTIVACSDDDAPIPVRGVSLEAHTISVAVNQVDTLRATITPGNASNRGIFWTSRNPDIATVNARGFVTGAAAGEVFVVVTTRDGEFRDSARVTVTDPAANIAGIVIDGIRWATRNVDTPGTFAQSPESTGMFFQWNRQKGWAATGNIANWDTSIPAGTVWEAGNNPCPDGWRLPTEAEWRSLLDVGGVWRVRGGVGGRLFGTVPYQIFLPAAGFRSFGTGVLGDVGVRGNYWSSAQHDEFRARHLSFNNSGEGIENLYRLNGFSVRCVAITAN